MPLTLEVPDDIRTALESRWSDLSAHIREGLAVEGYRQGLLSLAQVRRLLGFQSRLDAQQFLGRNGVAVFDFDPSELDREASLQRDAVSRPAAPRE